MPRQSRVVLGLNLSHDRSACLVIDGQIKVAIAEERLSRIKHDVPLNAYQEYWCQCPTRAIRYCLEEGCCSLSDIDLVVASTTYVYDTTTGRRRSLRAEDITRQCEGLPSDRVRILSHHLGHAISAAWCSGFNDAAVIVVDGGGSIVKKDPQGHPAAYERTTIYHMENLNLKVVQQSTGDAPDYGNSIGDFYQLITMYLGFRRGEEGKTMGLAAYDHVLPDSNLGTTNSVNWKPLPQFENAIIVNEDGTHSVSPSFQFTASTSGIPEQFIKWFGPSRAEPTPDRSLDRHIAASAQWAIEKALVELSRFARNTLNTSRLCLAGGVALNCVANGTVVQEGLFDRVFIQPASSDDGTALGNAFYGWKVLTGKPANSQSWSAYTGRSYGVDEVNEALKRCGSLITVHHSRSIVSDIAESIASGLIVGMFRGRSEFGPRALGHRSIFCDSRRPDMQDYLNSRVKHRERFRPFAPMVLEERASEFFELSSASPYMLLVGKVICPKKIPAVTHVDGSARIQTVNEEQESFLCDLLRAFEALTGVPVILNTSFNVAGEPIVESPDDALRCFLSTGMDVLYLEDIRVTRSE